MSNEIVRLLIAFAGKPDDRALKAAKAASDSLGREANICDIMVEENPSLSIARNKAALRAKIKGYDYLFLLGSDILLEQQDILQRLLKREKQAICPWLDSGGSQNSDPVFPRPEKEATLERLNWGSLDCCLFNMDAFLRLSLRPFADHGGEYDGLWFRACGVEWWMDLSVTAKRLAA